MNISGISQTNTFSNKMIDIFIHANTGSGRRLFLSCAVLEKITNKLPQVFVDVNKLEIPEDIVGELADPDFFTPSYSLLRTGIRQLGGGFPSLVSTDLGWIIAGSLPARCTSVNKRSFSLSANSQDAQTQVAIFAQTSEVEKMLSKFWELEEIDHKTILTPEDEQVETIFSTTQILDDGAYQLDMPLKSPHVHLKLVDSYHIAKRRFISLEKGFQNNPSL